jgi:hypothetical protein
MVDAVVPKEDPPFDQTKLKVPPDGVAVTVPLLLQVGWAVLIVMLGSAFTVTGKLSVLGQPYLVIPPTIDLE